MAIFFANAALNRIDAEYYKPNSTFSMAEDPEIFGPDKLCLISGGVIGEFFGAGDPDSDVYMWKILGPSDEILFEDEGRGKLQTIRYTFSLKGTHTIELEVMRGGISFYSESKDVELIAGPTTVLKSSYSICAAQEIELQAIDPASPNFEDYVFEWKNEIDTIISTQNTFKTSDLGEYSVSFYFINAEGEDECTTTKSTIISALTDIEIIASRPSLCPGDYINFKTDPPTEGQWSFEKIGPEGDKIPFGTSTSINLSSIIDLEGPGDYKVYFDAENPSNPSCNQAKSFDFTYYDQPKFEFLEATSSSGCQNANGAIQIRAITHIDQLSIKGTAITSSPLSPGDTVTLDNLKSGIYAVSALLGTCTNTIGTVVPLEDPPEQLKFEIEDKEPELCTATGKILGSFRIKITNGTVTAKYKVIDERGNLIRQDTIANKSEIFVEIPGGMYYVELFDENDCTLPRAEKVIIPSLEQVDFSVPQMLSVCQSYELYPSKPDLAYTITYLVDNTVTSIAPGEAFTITQAGDYEIIGVLPDQTEICPRQKFFTVDLVDPVDFEPKQIEEDCFGNQIFIAEIFGRDPETVTFKWYNEDNVLVSEDQSLVPYSYGEYKLDVQPANSTACPIPPKPILIEKPVLKVDIEFEYTKLCDLGPGSNISLIIDQPQAVTDILWRRFDEDGNTEDLPQFTNKYNITVTEPGTYEASAYSIIPELNKDCPLGINTFRIDVTPDLVIFDILPDISICETYDYTPITTDGSIIFEIVRPDNTKIEINAGESVTLDQNGDYTFFGYNPNLDYPLCPEIKTMNVEVYEKINFSPELFQKDCNGEKIYKANIGDTDPDDVLFTWFDSNGNPIGSDQFLTLNTHGNFSLDVQPKGSLPCDQEWKDFVVEPPILSVPVRLESDPLCPDATAAAIRATADFSLVQSIQWWFTDPDGLESELTALRGKEEILAINEGTYEVRLFNEVPCLLGDDRVLILRSTDPVRPEVEEGYQVCPKYEIGPLINPGSFASYEWYYEDRLVATSPTFKPLQIGKYNLIVYSNEGCAYQADFITEEECELKVTYPNAIQPSNPDKPFLIYTNYLVDELEVYIFNKWGQMVFQCAEKDLISEESTCLWDGRYNGKAIPNGSYAIKINFINLEKNISRTQTGSVLVVE